MSGLQRYCVVHGDWVDQDQAAIIPATATSLEPDWACHGCIPARPAQFIGRRDVAPIPPGDAA